MLIDPISSISPPLSSLSSSCPWCYISSQPSLPLPLSPPPLPHAYLLKAPPPPLPRRLGRGGGRSPQASTVSRCRRSNRPLFTTTGCGGNRGPAALASLCVGIETVVTEGQHHEVGGTFRGAWAGEPSRCFRVHQIETEPTFTIFTLKFSGLS